MAYAENTTVPVSRSQAELLRILEKHGCDDIVQANSKGRQKLIIQFSYEGIPCRLALPIPSPQEERFHLHGSGWKLSATEAEKKYQKELRRIWRCLVLIVKARFEELDAELFSAQEVLAPWLVLPCGATVGEALREGGDSLIKKLEKAMGTKMITWGEKGDSP